MPAQAGIQSGDSLFDMSGLDPGFRRGDGSNIDVPAVRETTGADVIKVDHYQAAISSRRTSAA
ncbi:MAG: hypothetical protein EHM16_07595 [Betaproteobacteria bacterium]|nr:MAG: hypothetical protein EHM16_07595 [Betaproteobacteria bacterium]